MPAHKRPIRVWSCNQESCSRKAIFEVYDTFNRLIGRFCGAHADGKVSRLNQPKGRQ